MTYSYTASHLESPTEDKHLNRILVRNDLDSDKETSNSSFDLMKSDQAPDLGEMSNILNLDISAYNSDYEAGALCSDSGAVTHSLT